MLKTIGFSVLLFFAIPLSQTLFAQYNPPAYNEAFDLAMKMTTDWNKAIDEHTPEKLRDLYAAKARVYGQEMERDAIIQGKTKWLTAHPSYRQNAPTEKIRAFAENFTEEPEGIEVMFTKITMDAGKKQEYIAFLNFGWENGELKIVGETDQTTEINLAKKASGIQLVDGNFCMFHEVFQDVRGSGLGHYGPIRITTDLHVELKAGKVSEGYFTWYSGFSRMLQEWKIISGFQNANKELELRVQMLDDAELEPVGAIQTVKIKPLSEGVWVIIYDHTEMFLGLELLDAGCGDN